MSAGDVAVTKKIAEVPEESNTLDSGKNIIFTPEKRE